MQAGFGELRWAGGEQRMGEEHSERRGCPMRDGAGTGP